MSRDWVEWHADYADDNSSLTRRLHVVRVELRRILGGHPGRLVSVCAGRGADVLPVLAENHAHRLVETWLIENHHLLAADARRHAIEYGLDNVRVLERDAGRMRSYEDIGPADVLLMCGVFGNISDRDIHRTIDAMPQLLSGGAHLIWTRSRRKPDITATIRQHLGERHFTELGFIAPEGDLWSVGVHRFDGRSETLRPGGTMFEFIV